MRNTLLLVAPTFLAFLPHSFAAVGLDGPILDKPLQILV